MLNLGKTHDHLTVVNDQFGSPTYTYDLARLLVDMVLTDKYGIYHATNEGICNWYEFACEIFRQGWHESGCGSCTGFRVSDESQATGEQPHEQSQADRERIRKASFLAGCVREISERNPVNRLCVSRKITGNTSGSGIGNGTAPILANVHHRAFKRDGVQSIQIE